MSSSKNRWLLPIAFVALLSVISMAQASDIKNARNPMYEGVKRVYIFVDYRDGGEGNDIPAPLKRTYLEELIVGLYQKRFSSKECMSVMGGTNPYSCDDQPVIRVPAADRSEFIHKQRASVATEQELRDPDTLLVTLDVNVIRDLRKDNPDYDKRVFFDPPLETPLVAFQLRQERRVSSIGLDKTEWITPPFALPLNQKDKKIDAMMTSLIRERLRY